MSLRVWERRRSRRVDVLAREVACDGRAISGMYPISNLSREGALLVGGAVPPIGEHMHMELEADCGVQIALAGRAVRHCVSPLGQRMFGVLFEQPSDLMGALLRQTIRAEAKRETSPVLVVARYGWPGNRLIVDLRAIGRRTVTATTSDGALEYLAGLDRVDAVVVDVSRPDLCGASLLAEIARRHPLVHRVVLSGPIPSPESARVIDSSMVHAELGARWTLASLDASLVRPARPASRRAS